ncbi:MAG: hypothetical protein DMG21_09415 [Acidobacteria bacterium]|nr:MAG: hypothetical protein DMG21_09415 [Acidobacteriota bacterium]
MKKRLSLLCLVLAFSATMALVAAESQSWTGVVSDSMCGAKHSAASDDAAACVAKCVSGGAKYALVVGDKVYQLSPQDKFKDFAGKSVKVTGAIDGETITAETVEAASGGQ